jgi:hypothetical protein
MGLFSSIKRHSVGIICEMLTLKDPYDQRVEVKELGRRLEPNRDLRGRPTAGCREVVTIQANNYRDLEQFTNGTTPADGTRVLTHVGHNRWEISTEELDTLVPGQNQYYQEWLDNQRY